MTNKTIDITSDALYNKAEDYAKRGCNENDFYNGKCVKNYDYNDMVDAYYNGFCQCLHILGYKLKENKDE